MTTESTTSHWKKVRFGDVAEYINGKAFNAKLWDTSGLPIVRIQNLTDDSKPFNYTSVEHEERYKIGNGDLLFSWSATLDAFIWNRGDAWLNQHIFKVVPKDCIDRKFLFYVLKITLRQFYQNTHGSGMVHITKGKFENTNFLLPPFAEQQKIVSKLDDVLGHILSLKLSMERIPEILKQFRQTVLTQAVGGRLTKDWRKNKPLKNVDLECSFASFRSMNMQLPDSWTIYAFGDAAEIKSNLVDPNKHMNLPLIAPDNIEKETGRLITTPLTKEIQPKSGKHLYHANVILYSKIRPYLSKVVMVDFEGLCSADMYPVESRIDTMYLFYYMLSQTFLEFATTAGERSVLPKINQQALNIIPVPVPPHEEQTEIVRRVESLLAKADAIEARYKVLKEKIDQLPQAILAKAMCGEL